MEALRKAEEGKRGKRITPRSPALNTTSALALEPFATAATPSAARLPLLAQHFEALNADLASPSAASASGPPITPPDNKRPAASPEQTARASREEEQERNTARNMFALKHAQQARTQRRVLFGLLAAALLGIGGSFWWQMQSVFKGSFVRPLAPAPLTTTAPAQVDADKLAPAPLPALIAALVRSATAAELPAKPEAAARIAPPQALSDNPIRLSTRQPKANPTLERAYQALQADQAGDARRDYEQVLRTDARNVDALLGLAILAARQGQVSEASEFYRRTLEADPKNVNALAGLINLRGQADPGLSESRLKTLLASQPDSSALNFALGNLQAGQNRWSEAQQAYFRAYTVEPNNADYLYNLAVSLDHLHQNKLAAQYYQSALGAAGTRSSVFDKNQIKRRLLDLQP